MENILLKNHHAAIFELMSEGRDTLEEMELHDFAEEIAAQAQQAQSKKVPTIMFYGLYNAGKSTLINALCEKEVAKVGDVPTTASIQSVPWKGYDLVDTPGINAKEEHTQIAIGEIDRSDLILFVVDNADGFEREIVSHTVVEVLKRGKPVAVVINQKNCDESEDPSIPVPMLPSMERVSAKVAENLRRHSLAEGRDILEEKKNFLGLFLVNAKTAFEASLCTDPGAAALLRQNAGIESLANAIDQSIRASVPVRMLLTPAVFLKEKLKEALSVYQSTALHSEQKDLMKERKILSESRQRTGDRLLAEGLRKIEAAFEQIRVLASEGKSIDAVPQQLQKELTDLIAEVTNQEGQIVNVELGISGFQTGQIEESTGQAETEIDVDLETILSAVGRILTRTPSPLPMQIPIEIVAVVINAFVKWIGSVDKEQREAEQRARESAERLAAFYKWQNELRDQEAQVKANYTSHVEDALHKMYDGQLEKLNAQLVRINDACARYAAYVEKVEKLLVRVSEEIAALSLNL